MRMIHRKGRNLLYYCFCAWFRKGNLSSFVARLMVLQLMRMTAKRVCDTFKGKEREGDKWLRRCPLRRARQYFLPSYSLRLPLPHYWSTRGGKGAIWLGRNTSSHTRQHHFMLRDSAILANDEEPQRQIPFTVPPSLNAEFPKGRGCTIRFIQVSPKETGSPVQKAR